MPLGTAVEELLLDDDKLAGKQHTGSEKAKKIQIHISKIDTFFIPWAAAEPCICNMISYFCE